jgi:hypothetical protein
VLKVVLVNDQYQPLVIVTAESNNAIIRAEVVKDMSLAQFDSDRPAVSFMRAASIANVHLSTIYKLRSKLGAFQQDDLWYIPLAALEEYMEERANRARSILESSSVIPAGRGPRK